MPTRHEDVTLKLEIDWGNDGYTGADDMSAYMEKWSFNIGIDQSLLDARVASVGEMSLTLKNTDKRFTPRNASGPYYGNLKNRRPVRLTATAPSGTYTLFTGRTKRIEPVSGSGSKNDRTVTIECVDTMKQIQSENVALPLLTSSDTAAIAKAVVNHCLVAPVATDTIIFNGNPANNDTLTINGTLLTYKSTLSGSADEILIGPLLSDTILYTSNAVNKGPGNGVQYATNMSYQNLVRSSQPTGDTLNGGTTTFSEAYIGNPGGVHISRAQMFTVLVGGQLTQIVVRMGANLGAPTGTMTWQLRTGDGGTTGPNADIVASGIFTPVVSSDNTINITGGPTLDAGKKYWIAFRATVQQTVGNSFAIAYQNSGAAGGDQAYSFSDGNAPWTDEPGIALRLSIKLATGTPTLTLSSTLRGAAGNAITLAKSSANLAIGGATFSGGSDYPSSPAPSYETALRSYDYAGDQWSFSNTNGVRALQDLMDSEYGLFYCSGAGVLTFKNGDYLFRAITQTPKMTITGETDVISALDEDAVFTRVNVTYTPRGTLAAGVVAKSNGQIAVPGTSGATPRYNPADPLPANTVVVKIPFTDPTTGQKMGANTIITPLVGGTDYTANERSDFTGISYTNNANLSFSLAITGNTIEITITNTALGTLYINGLQVRGTGITMYNTVSIAAEDSTKWTEQGKLSKTHAIPLPSDQNFAAGLAQYLLTRYIVPNQRIERITLENINLIGGVNTMAVNIGDVILTSDTQAGFSNVRCLVTAIHMSGDRHNATRTEFTVYPLDDTTYFVLDDTTYGLLDGPSVLAI